MTTRSFEAECERCGTRIWFETGPWPPIGSLFDRFRVEHPARCPTDEEAWGIREITGLDPMLGCQWLNEPGTARCIRPLRHLDDHAVRAVRDLVKAEEAIG